MIRKTMFSFHDYKMTVWYWWITPLNCSRYLPTQQYWSDGQHEMWTYPFLVWSCRDKPSLQMAASFLGNVFQFGQQLNGWKKTAMKKHPRGCKCVSAKRWSSSRSRKEDKSNLAQKFRIKYRNCQGSNGLFVSQVQCSMPGKLVM